MSKLIATPGNRNSIAPAGLADDGLVAVWFVDDLDEIADAELRERAAAALKEGNAIADAFEQVDYIAPIADTTTGELTCNIWFHDDQLLTVLIEQDATILDSIACAVLTRQVEPLPRVADSAD